MIVARCKKNINGQLLENENYYVIEVIVDCNHLTIEYRVIDNYGTPAIYEAELFQLIFDNIDSYHMYSVHGSIILSIIEKSDYNKWKGHIDGFWGAYFEGDLETNKKLVRLLMKEGVIEEIED